LGEEINKRLQPPVRLQDEGVWGNVVTTLSRSTKPALDVEWNEKKIKEAVGNAIKDMGGLDVLIVSSGLGAYMTPTASDADVKKMYQTNVFGPMTVFKACQKALLKSKGKALFISSTCARRPGSGGLSVYGSTKAAMNSWVQNEGRRQAKHGIALAAVAPGWFDSPMTDTLKLPVREAAEKAIPFGRFGSVGEVAKFTVDLLNQSNWVLAGQVFECSGGA
jgi:NAD(P)-dependent dehydrogenase (short-subunit alcohol dehydrogenase family)